MTPDFQITACPCLPLLCIEACRPLGHKEGTHPFSQYFQQSSGGHADSTADTLRHTLHAPTRLATTAFMGWGVFALNRDLPELDHREGGHPYLSMGGLLTHRSTQEGRQAAQ